MDGEEYNKKFQYINERTQGRIQGGGGGGGRALRNWKKYDFLA